MMIYVKRVSDPVEESDGHRILVDRLWPRGMRKEALVHEAWMRGVSPSTALRQWFGHDPAKWDEFRKRYWRELDAIQEDVEELLSRAKSGNVTLLFRDLSLPFKAGKNMKYFRYIIAGKTTRLPWQIRYPYKPVNGVKDHGMMGQQLVYGFLVSFPDRRPVKP